MCNSKSNGKVSRVIYGRTVLLWLACFTLFAEIAAAGSLVEVTIVDRNNRPVPDAAVYWRPNSERRTAAATGTTAVMDQVDTKFVPHILIVQSGTSVQFPNSDTVAHHVYSFSHPNQFKLPIYKGDAHPPVTFSEGGLVILGCNIHDNMLGYILVVDSPAFDKTDARGMAQLAISSNDGEIVIWSPRFRDSEDRLVQPLMPSGGDRIQTYFQLNKTLRPEFGDKAGTLSWSEY